MKSLVIHNRVTRERKSWDRTHIPKSMRKGKSVSELEKMRKKLFKSEQKYV